MSILTRYILRELFYHLAIILGLFTVIILAKEMFDTRDEILEQKPSFISVAQYVVLNVPRQVVEAIPLISMFAAIFSLGLMAKNREIIAMVSAGISFNQLAVPVLIYGATVTAGSYYLTEYLAPAAQSHAHYVYEVEIKRESREEFFSNDNLFRKGGGGRFYIMGNYEAANKRMTRPSILDLNSEGNGLAQRIEAASGRIVQSPDGKKQFWEFEGAERWTFQNDGTVAIEKFTEPLRIEMEEKLDTFLSREKDPEEMSLMELRDYCSILSRHGGSAILPKYQTSLQVKLAIPLSCLVLAMIGFAVATDLRTRHFVLAFSVGLLLGMAYYVSREALFGLGRSGALNRVIGDLGPYAAAWLPITLFGLIALHLTRRLSTVH